MAEYSEPAAATASASLYCSMDPRERKALEMVPDSDALPVLPDSQGVQTDPTEGDALDSVDDNGDG